MRTPGQRTSSTHTGMLRASMGLLKGIYQTGLLDLARTPQAVRTQLAVWDTKPRRGRPAAVVISQADYDFLRSIVANGSSSAMMDTKIYDNCIKARLLWCYYSGNVWVVVPTPAAIALVESREGSA